MTLDNLTVGSADALQFRTIAGHSVIATGAAGGLDSNTVMHAETQICWTNMMLCEQLWTQLLVPYSVEVQCSSTFTAGTS